MTDDEPTLARAGRHATWLIVAHVVFILIFAAGGVLTLWAFVHNGDASMDCFDPPAAACGSHRSYVPGATLLAVGFVGNLVTIAVAARLAIGYGLGVAARYSNRVTR